MEERMKYELGNETAATLSIYIYTLGCYPNNRHLNEKEDLEAGVIWWLVWAYMGDFHGCGQGFGFRAWGISGWGLLFRV